MLRAVIEMAIDCAADLPALAAWWRDHQHALQLLDPSDLAVVVAVKDHRKRLLNAASIAPSQRQYQPRLV